MACAEIYLHQISHTTIMQNKATCSNKPSSDKHKRKDWAQFISDLSD